MHINQLINPSSLRHDMAMGMIRKQQHPTLPLEIYNYTERAQFARHWSQATLLCRGLIVNTETKQIVARPFKKFFNWDEKHKGIGQIDLDELVTVTDKIDGSLGILYDRGDRFGHCFATRGSFTSDQARHANAVWLEKYHKKVEHMLDPGLTYLFEIVYPDNRIVVDYKGQDDLVLLGAVHIGTGVSWGPEVFPGWPGPRARTFPYQTLREAVHERPRQGYEGFVVRSLDNGLMVKVKYDDYVSLHRVVTGLNEKEIWRRCMKADLENGPEVDKLDLVMRDIPDEMHEWVIGVAHKLRNTVVSRLNHARSVFMQALPSQIRGLDDRGARKRFAERIKIREPWLQKTLWILYDNNDPREFLWKTIEPKGDTKK